MPLDLTVRSSSQNAAALDPPRNIDLILEQIDTTFLEVDIQGAYHDGATHRRQKNKSLAINIGDKVLQRPLGDRFVGSCPCLDVLRRALASFFPSVSSPATRLQLMARLCVLWIVCYLVTTLAMGALLLIRDDARVHARDMMMQDMPTRS